MKPDLQPAAHALDDTLVFLEQGGPEIYLFRHTQGVYSLRIPQEGRNVTGTLDDVLDVIFAKGMRVV